MAQRIEIGNADLSPLGPYVERFDQLMAEVEAAKDIVPNATNRLTARFIDENQPAGPRTYMHAYSGLQSAQEHSQALWALLGSGHGLTPRAPWTLVRSIFEAGFWSTWILDSDHSYVRRQRGLKVEIVDYTEHKKWVNSLPIEPSIRAGLQRSDQSVNTYKSECQALGLKWDTAGTKPAVANELLKLDLSLRSVTAEAPALGAFMSSTWRSLSGLEHGHPYAMQVHMDMTSPITVVGGQTFTVSVNDDSFVLALKCAYALAIEAAALFISRSSEQRRTRPRSPD